MTKQSMLNDKNENVMDLVQKQWNRLDNKAVGGIGIQIQATIYREVRSPVSRAESIAAEPLHMDLTQKI